MMGATIERIDFLQHRYLQITLRCDHAVRLRRFTAVEIITARDWHDLVFVWAQREIVGVEAEFEDCRCWRQVIQSLNPTCSCDPPCWFDRLMTWLNPQLIEAAA